MRDTLLRVCAGIDRLNVIGASLAAICCALLAAILITEVIVTSQLNWSQPWAVEYSAYLCALALFAGCGYAVRQGSHIRVRVLLNQLPQPVAVALELFCTLAALAVASIICYGMIELTLRSLQRGSKSYFVMETPLFIPQGLLAASAILLLLALLARLLRILLGEPPDVVQHSLSDTDVHH